MEVTVAITGSVGRGTDGLCNIQLGELLLLLLCRFVCRKAGRTFQLIVLRATTVWDVRTKKVAWEEIPLVGRFGINGICVYGPAGMLFTLSEDHSVQQFTLQPQALVANVLHHPNVPPPSPPVSIEEKKEELRILDNDTLHSEAEDNTSPDEMKMERRMTPLGRIAQELEKLEHMEQKQMEQKQMEQQQSDGGLGISIPKQRSGSVSSTASAGSTGS